MKQVASILVIAGLCASVVWFLRTGTPPPTEVSFSGPEEAFSTALNALNAGKTTRVREAIHCLESSEGFTGHVLVLDAIAALRAKRFENALRILMSVPRDDRLRNVVLLYTGQAYYGLQQLPEAEHLLAALLNIDPDNLDGHRMLGAVYYDLGAFDNAFIHMNRVTELAPDDYRPHRVMGLMYRDFEQNVEAIQQYRLALDKQPDDRVTAAIRLELAETFVAQKQFADASTQLSELEPSVRSLTLQARCAWNRGDEEETTDLISRARAAGLPERTLSLLIADVEASRNNPTAALREMEQATERWPHDAECHYRFAQLLRENGHTEKSTSAMQKFQQAKDRATQLTKLNIQAIREPTNADVRNELAELCETLDKPELAHMWRRAAESVRSTEPQPVD